MKLARTFSIVVVAAECFGLFAASVGAEAADRGTCSLDASKASGTYGFATEGGAVGDNPFVPMGPFSQAGTVTLNAQMDGTSALTGTWSVDLAQNDRSGYTPNVSFGGNFQVDRTTCRGDFYVTTPMQIAEPAFHVVFVNGGDEVRTIAAIPNLIVSYSTAKKL